MNEDVLGTLTLIVVLGITAQWLAWRLKLPSILLLLCFGVLAGPVTGAIDPDLLLGDLLLPLVSLAVALILFEGGMTLKLRELKTAGVTVRNLVTFGALVTWLLAAAGARWVLGWDWSLAILLGAILVVTGPTVVMPLLRHVQPSRPISSILKWEGIVIDPVGALLALLVFEAVLANELQQVAGLAFWGFFKTVLVGGVLGLLGALILTVFFRRYWVPDYLQNAVAIMLVVATFTLSNHLQEESGLLTVTLMGIALANQREVSVAHILEFKENLRVLLISALFILLAARLDWSDLDQLALGRAAGFLLFLLFVVRPAAVFAATLGSGLRWQERLFIAWMAPRGIVAAAVASVFALRLTEHGNAGAAALVPATFLVIVGTVAVYGLTAAPLAKALGISSPDPQGALLVGAHPLAREIAAALHREEFPVVLVDTNRHNLAAARVAGLPIHYGNILSEHAGEDIDLTGVGRLLALTPNDEVNTLAALHFIEFFGRAEVYQLSGADAGASERQKVSERLKGRALFAPGLTCAALEERLARGEKIRRTPLTETFDFAAFLQENGGAASPLFLLRGRELKVFTAEDPPEPAPGDVVISLGPGTPGPG